MKTKITKLKNDSLLLYGKAILVSGAASQIGKAISFQLASEGAKLILVDNERLMLNNLATDIKKSFNTDSLTIHLDFKKDRAHPYDILAKKIDSEITRLSAAILATNYTGYKGFSSNILSYPTPLWKEIIQVNLDANFILVKTLLPFLLSSSQPHLIFCLADSNNALQENNGAYGVAKYALEGLMKLIATETLTTHLSVFGVILENIMEHSNDNTKQNTLSYATSLIPPIIANKSKIHHGKVLKLLSKDDEK